MTVQSGQHPEISELIPWYVNGTIGDLDRQRVDEHLAECGCCRNELASEQRIAETMSADPSLEYMPAASFKRLTARLDRLPPATAPGSAPPGGSPSLDGVSPDLPSTRSPHAWRLAASLAALALAFGAVPAYRWMRSNPAGASADYHTVTASTPRPRDEVIRAVFSPTITLVELQAILEEAQLRIVAGPTEAGVYSLAAKSSRPVASSLALLRRHSAVRFAESTRAGHEQGAGESP